VNESLYVQTLRVCNRQGKYLLSKAWLSAIKPILCKPSGMCKTYGVLANPFGYSEAVQNLRFCKHSEAFDSTYIPIQPFRVVKGRQGRRVYRKGEAFDSNGVQKVLHVCIPSYLHKLSYNFCTHRQSLFFTSTSIVRL
jgi:hypothetical protein